MLTLLALDTIARAVSARHASHRLVIHSQHRVLDVCSLCGTEVEHDAAGPCCDGAEIERVAVRRPDWPSVTWTDEDEARWQERRAA